jgi:hypothetical protein
MADPNPDDVQAHWAQLCEGLQASTFDFYQQVTAAAERRSIPHMVVEAIEYREAGAFSGVRQYLRLRRRREVFDICGAPFGNGFFFSWWFAELKPSLPSIFTIFIVLGYLAIVGWLMRYVGMFEGPALIVLAVPLLLFLVSKMGNPEADDLVLQLPIISWLYARFFRPITYYRIDTSQMYQQAVHNAVMEVVDQMTQGRGLRPFTELERKPIMRDFFKK